VGYLLPLALSLAADPAPRTWTVNGVKREALVVVPAGTPTRLVFDFHGHGGTARHAARAHALHTHLPDAVVVYPQGLNTPGRLTDPEGKKSGWQHDAGDHGDRDLKFFDAMLSDLLKDHGIDPKRASATGHSNGGAFTYLLWAERGDKLAAVAPVAAVCWPTALARLKPKPCLHVAGEADPLVKFAGQRRTMDAVRKVNGCVADGSPWAGKGKRFAGKADADLVEAIHPGGHEYPAFAAELVAKFFRQHPAD
jgi:polyhydroxybutyrate depolymerase